MDTNLHDIAHQLTYHPKSRLDDFRSLPKAQAKAVFDFLSPHIQQDILDGLDISEAVAFLEYFEPLRIHKVLLKMRDTGRRTRIFKRLTSENRQKVETFLRFHPKASADLLSFNYLLLPADMLVERAGASLDQHVRETGKIPEVLVHDNGILVGEVSMGVLVQADNTTMLGLHTHRVTTIPYQAKVEDIITIISKSTHKKVIVLDAEDKVLGIIYADDVLALLGHEPASMLYDFAGVEDVERPFDGILSKVKHRYRWLILNLATGFLAATVVSQFENTISQYVLLAAYMPIVAGMGGNAATQALAVTVRGITLGEIDLANGAPAIMREVGAGLVNGLIVGVIIAVAAYVWNEEPLLGAVAAAAMVINLVVAGFFGALVPLVMKRLGKDPATSATIFITTATDVFGFLAFLGLATIVLL